MTNSSIYAAFERMWEHILRIMNNDLQRSIVGEPGQFVVIGRNGKPTTQTILIAEEESF